MEGRTSKEDLEKELQARARLIKAEEVGEKERCSKGGLHEWDIIAHGPAGTAFECLKCRTVRESVSTKNTETSEFEDIEDQHNSLYTDAEDLERLRRDFHKVDAMRMTAERLAEKLAGQKVELIEEINDLRRCGDTLQSAFDRLATYLQKMEDDDRAQKWLSEFLGYENYMAFLEGRREVERWTEIRRKSKLHKADPQ